MSFDRRSKGKATRRSEGQDKGIARPGIELNGNAKEKRG
jgi:hypothetical protein